MADDIAFTYRGKIWERKVEEREKKAHSQAHCKLARAVAPRLQGHRSSASGWS